MTSPSFFKSLLPESTRETYCKVALAFSADARENTVAGVSEMGVSVMRGSGAHLPSNMWLALLYGVHVCYYSGASEVIWVLFFNPATMTSSLSITGPFFITPDILL